jgi:hypothetical protein
MLPPARPADVHLPRACTQTKQKEKQLQRELEPEPVQDPQWRVLLHNDEYHTFDFVSLTVTKVRYVVAASDAARRLTEGGAGVSLDHPRQSTHYRS